jgi:hypothetical protein
VIAIPCASKLDCETGHAPRIVEAASGREFEISGLKSGFYKIAVVNSDSGAWTGPTFMLPSGQTATVTAVLSRDCEKSQIVFENHTKSGLEEYTHLLSSFHEPPLCSKPEGQSSSDERYRVIWERTGYPTVIVTMSLNGDDGLTVQYKQGASASEDGLELAADEVLDVSSQLLEAGLDEEDSLDFIHQMGKEPAASGFWELPFAVEDGSIVLNGSRWTIEGLRDESCHVVKRESPESDNPVRRLAWEIINLSGRDFVYDEVF